MDVAQWLNAIGLGQYEALFREHEIDADVLPDLTEADLEKIGVPLGHRKRLMRAIAASPRRRRLRPPEARARRAFALADAPARTPSGGRSRSCSAISSARRASRPNLTRKTGAISSAPISTKLGRGDGARRPCAEKTRRRADGPLRLPACAGERRRARGARRARHPARARRPQRQERRQGAPELAAAHRPRVRAGRGGR